MAGKIKNKRNATEAPPTVIVIKPDGHFYLAPLASNLNDGHIKVIDGEPVIRPASAKKGYILLDDGADSPEQAAALRRYFEVERQHKGAVAPIPERYLPKLCVERRKAKKAATVVDFEKLLAEAKAAQADAEDEPSEEAASPRGRARARA